MKHFDQIYSQNLSYGKNHYMHGWKLCIKSYGKSVMGLTSKLIVELRGKFYNLNEGRKISVRRKESLPQLCRGTNSSTLFPT